MPIAFGARSADAAACRERLWDKLCRSPSIFGRLVSIAESRCGETGRYEYPLCEFDAALVDSTLLGMHQEVFETWLNFRLQQQERDLSVLACLVGLQPGGALPV